MICLIRPPAVESFRFATTSITPPIGIAYIAAAIEESGRDVFVIDAVGKRPKIRVGYFKGYLVGMDLDEIVDHIPPESKIIGVTVVFTHEWPAVVRLVGLIKKAYPDVRVVLGGEHVTAMPEFSLATSLADFVVMGEGEETVIELLDAVENGGDVLDITGIAFRTSGGVHVNPRRARRTDIDSIPRPAWHHFDLKSYHAHRFVGGMYSEKLTVPILATRGCPYQCTYCASPEMWSPRWIPRDPILVVDEIQSYVEDYEAGNFPFQDLTAIIQKDWIVTFCTEIINRGLKITWLLPTGTRSEAIDREVAELLRDSGMVSMAYAPESGSETTRRLIKKRMKTETLFESIRAANASRLNVAIFLVIGFPHDSRESLEENIAFIDHIAREGVKDLSVGFYMALPGTELFHTLFDSGKIRLDRAYFRHILDSSSLLPSQSYTENIGVLDLAMCKLKMFLRFYGPRNRRHNKRFHESSLLSEIVKGFNIKNHQTRLQTALHNGMGSAWITLACSLKAGWIRRSEEHRMFDDWDRIYGFIRKAKVTGDVVQRFPSDSRELHKRNIIHVLRSEQTQSYEVKLQPLNSINCDCVTD